LRLTQIKLAGFKSFVDPTAIATPGQLVGIVGPNGCGKSNVIDAVRWVLGESKASALRGESMQDVIFNGAGERKPVGRASVELHFDNSLGPHRRPVGAIRRDLDQARADPRRRFDVLHQQHSGAAPGHPRSLPRYRPGPARLRDHRAGMITRVVEAKPEELRIFLEEAAGVSKYKERRKETEGRLA
jgi:chromosome segregation protein